MTKNFSSGWKNFSQAGLSSELSPSIRATTVNWASEESQPTSLAPVLVVPSSLTSLVADTQSPALASLAPSPKTALLNARPPTRTTSIRRTLPTSLPTFFFLGCSAGGGGGKLGWSPAGGTS